MITPPIEGDPIKVRKKPVVVEAMHFDATPGRWAQLAHWINANDGHAWYSFDDGGRLVIDTLEGAINASVGDWIIRGVKGEFYPCKPDIFLETYVMVDTEKIALGEDETDAT